MDAVRVRVMWGWTDCNGWWWANPVLMKTPEEQLAENILNGYSCRTRPGLVAPVALGYGCAPPYRSVSDVLTTTPSSV